MDNLRIEELKGRETTQALVETEIYLNPSKRHIERILWTDGTVEILSTKVIRDRLVVSGVIKFKAVYKSPEENHIYTLDANGDFREEIEMLGITEDMSAIVKSDIEYIEYEILDERKLSLRALVSLEGKVEEIINIEIIKEIGGRQDLEILTETIRYRENQGRETSYAIIKESLEIKAENPAIEEILKTSIRAYEVESTVVDDRIIVSGMIDTNIVYYGEDKIATLEEKVPFNHFLEMPGVKSGASEEISIEVVEGDYEVLEDQMGELKTLDMEVKLKICGAAYLENEKELVIDAYSTKEKIRIITEEVNLNENVVNTIYKENIIKDLSDYKIKEIYSVTGKPSIIDSKIMDEELVVEGILSLEAIYHDYEDINVLKEEIPYKYYLPIEIVRNPIIDIDTDLEEIGVNLSKDIFIIESSIKHKIKINRNRDMSIIKSIEETNELIDKKNRPSIIIYIVQKNDILWDIAKRYNTTVDEILLGNENLDPENIMPGEKILIEKTVDIVF